MRIINIVLKDIKLNFKEKRVLAIMILFPIVLMVILGTVLNDQSQNVGSIGNINVAYELIGEGEITESFETMIEELSKTEDIIFTRVEEGNKVMDDIKNLNYACFIVVNEREREIKLYENDRFNFEATFVEAIMATFVQRYNTIMEVAKINPQMVARITGDSSVQDDFVNIKSVVANKTPSALDYYGVTMLTLIIMYSSMTGAFAVKGEKLKNTVGRMLISPTNKMEIFVGSTLGAVFTTIIQMGIVFSFSKYVLKVYWGNNIGAILLIILSLIIMAVSLGIASGYMFKNSNAMEGFLNLLIPIMCFLGGAYISVSGFQNKIFIALTKLSPVKWVNSTIFNIIYNNNFSDLGITIAINLGLAMVFMILASLRFNREAE